MIHSRSRAIARFLELRSVREARPASLMSRLSRGGEGDLFYRQAQKLGADPLWIQSAETMVRRYGDGDESRLRWLLLYFLELSSRGHIRISVGDLAEDFPLWAGEVYPACREMEAALPGLLEKNPRLFAPIPAEGASPAGAAVLYDREIRYFYLLKKFRFEKSFLEVLGRFTEGDLPCPEGRDQALQAEYDRLAGHSPLPLSAETMEAARILGRSRLSVITGGPGTGKTTILSGMLRLYLGVCGAVPEVRLCAPTGRAAKRIAESMAPLLEDAAFSGAFRHPAGTIHKLLGLRPGQAPRFGEERHLQADILVVDEASMVDLRLMTLLLKALKPAARLVLVGDRDQLPSVESGALLSDLLHGLGQEGYRLEGRVLSLSRVHRNSGDILEASRLIIRGETEGFLHFLKAHPGPLTEPLNREAGWVAAGALPPYRLFLEEIRDFFRLLGTLPGEGRFSVSSGDWKQTVPALEGWFALYRNLAVLSPTKKGLYGTGALNRGLNALFSPRSPEGYHGQPLIITRNDYERELYNGDRGVVLRFQDGLFACFEQGGQDYRLIPLALLENWETAFAVTIHKSQGSEFRYVYTLVPEGSERLLSREILYTGITRAREGAVLYGSEESFRLCLARGVRRLSGIRDFMIKAPL